MQTPKICILDDQPAVCDSLEFLFTSHYDVSVETYLNPILFLNTVSSDWRGCLIIDFFMPLMSGIDVIKELQARKNQMTMILTSGHGDVAIATRILVDETFIFFKKPLNITYLLEVVGKALKPEKT